MNTFHLSLARFAVAVLLTNGVTACCKKEPPVPAPQGPAAPASQKLQPSDVRMFGPLPATFDNPTNPPSDAKVALGQMLYHEKRLSKNQQIACDSCHDLERGGVDGKSFSAGHKGQLGGRNAPTVLNAAGHFVQFWDGRAKDVEEQAKGPILNPVEMAMASSETVLAVLRSMPEYVAAFQAAFPGEADALTWDNLGRAIGAFERKLVSRSRWDNYLTGDDAALTDEEKVGVQTFIATGCIACHAGVLVGGAMFQKAGLVKPWPNQKDVGRQGVTKNDADKLFFKVPSLRNIAKTAPYFHDGSVATLEQAIRQMAEHQLGKQLTEVQVASIAKWLGTLTGEVPAVWLAVPKLPPSTDTTPKPIAD